MHVAEGGFVPKASLPDGRTERQKRTVGVRGFAQAGTEARHFQGPAEYLARVGVDASASQHGVLIDGQGQARFEGQGGRALDRDLVVGGDQSRRYPTNGLRATGFQSASNDHLESVGDALGVLIVLTHQPLGAGEAVSEAEARRDLFLAIETQTIVASSGQQVQLISDAPQVRLGVLQLEELARNEDAQPHEIFEPAHLPARLGNPERNVEIAQTACALFDVRLEQVHGGAEPIVASARVHFQPFDEGGCVSFAEDPVFNLFRQLSREPCVPGQMPPIQNGGRRPWIRHRQLHQRRHVDDLVTDGDMSIPKGIQQCPRE